MIKTIVIGLTVFAITLASTSSAFAFAHANRFGGGTAHRFGATSHFNAFGGSTSHVAGVGTFHRNAFGGSTTHSAWGGTSHTNMYGGTTAGRVGYGAEHTTPWGTTAYASAYHPPTAYYGYHPPVTAGYYHAGCYYCGYGAAAVGAATGAAIGAAANAAVATAGITAPAMAYEMGAVYAVLPAGCASPDVHGQTYFLCGNTWFSPAYGANGVHYRVVPAP